MGLSGVGLAAKWLRGVDLNHRPLGYEPSTRILPAAPDKARIFPDHNAFLSSTS
jgi:hypothetical protein